MIQIPRICLTIWRHAVADGISVFELSTRLEGRDLKMGGMCEDRLSETNEFDRLANLHQWRVQERADFDRGVWVRHQERPSSVFADDTQGELDDLVDSSWWYVVRNSLLIRYVRAHGLSGTVWDVGSGTGIVSQALSHAGYQVVALEPGMRGAVAAAARGVPSVSSTLEELRLPSGCIAAVGLFDVIEHLGQPERDALLAECLRVLKPSGQLFLSVPAYTWLWSQADVLADHKCRYTKKSLRSQLDASGFAITDCSYRLASLVVPILLTRSLPWRLGYRPQATTVVRQLGVTSGTLTRIIHGFELAIGERCPVGTSLFACASPR